MNKAASAAFSSCYNSPMINTETSEVISAAKALPHEDRAAVVDSLVDSLYSNHEKVTGGWKVEVDRRIEAYRSGATKLVPAEVVFVKAKELLSK